VLCDGYAEARWWMREMSVVRSRNEVEIVEYRSGMRWDKIVVVWRGESKRMARNNDVS
jgi:hypothetical protein